MQLYKKRNRFTVTVFIALKSRIFGLTDLINTNKARSQGGREGTIWGKIWCPLSLSLILPIYVYHKLTNHKQPF